MALEARRRKVSGNMIVKAVSKFSSWPKRCDAFSRLAKLVEIGSTRQIGAVVYDICYVCDDVV